MAYVRANQAMNRALDLRASAMPSYRHLLVIDRAGISHDDVLGELGTGRPSEAKALSDRLRTILAEDGAGSDRT
jgi:hypothetical protein